METNYAKAAVGKAIADIMNQVAADAEKPHTVTHYIALMLLSLGEIYT